MDKKKNLYTIAFYNLENLFDTKDDPRTLDDDFTEDSEKNWNEKRFKKKVKKLGRIITQIGYEETTHPPVLLGVAEVENEYVVKKVAKSKFLKDKGYDYIHFDSPDERGIDTALLYRKEYFEVLSAEAFNLHIDTLEGVKDYTRDILHVAGKLQDEPIHLLINHWPSRRSGSEETTYKRIAAAKRNREIINQIRAKEPEVKILIMGDFNDDPSSESIKVLTDTDFYNPMEILHTKYSGSLNYKGGWNLFDQIIMSNNFLQEYGNAMRFETSKIFNPRELQEFKGRYKGNPYRTFVGKKYLGGISDHFPVYTVLSIDSIG